jgi:colanic acid biosynthesis glycosyl transferase WcaI
VEAYAVDEDRVVLLPNYTHINLKRTSKAAAKAQLGWPTDRTIAVHTGNMGLKQDLSNVVNAARLADERGSAVEFRLIGDGNQRPALEAAGRGVQRLVFQDPLDVPEYALALQAADILLVNERETVDDMSLPSKLTSYLVAARPVLAAVPADGATAGLINRAGAGPVVPSAEPAMLLDTVVALGADPERQAEHGRQGLAYAQAHLTRNAGLAATRAFVRGILPSVASPEPVVDLRAEAHPSRSVSG